MGGNGPRGQGGNLGGQSPLSLFSFMGRILESKEEPTKPIKGPEERLCFTTGSTSLQLRNVCWGGFG